MAVPVVQSQNTSTGASVSSVTITKPTGLTSGDLMVAFLAMYDGASANRTFSTPSGWTLVTKSTEGSSRLVRTACFRKVADSGDVAASNFTFSLSGSASYVSGYLSRITGQIASPSITIYESDDDNTTGGSSFSATTALTPATATNSLVMFNMACSASSPGSAPTTSAYATTPSMTWTELADIGVVSGDGMAHGIASASYLSNTQITARSASFSHTGSYHASSMVIVSGITDGLGTNSLLSVSPTHFSQSGSSGTLGTNALLEVSPTMQTQSGDATVPNVWTTQIKS
jgi:hypothetical protein